MNIACMLYTFAVGSYGRIRMWWNQLGADEQESIAANVAMLRQLGPNLPRPHVDTEGRI